MPKEKLTPQEKLFCYEYVRLGGGRHGGEAATLAGYTSNPASTRQRANRLLKRPRIDAEVKRQLGAQQEKRQQVNDVVGFDARAELADMARSWRESKKVEMCHVKAAIDYAHLSGDTPEAKKIMAEIQNKVAGAPLGPDGDFQPEWIKQRVN